MGFASGPITFRRFAVVGKAPAAPDQALLDKLEEFRLQESEFSVPDETEYGWCGGRHILDGTFSFENNVYADALVFAMRLDTNRVPGEVRRAYEMMEQDAAAASNPSGFISKKQKAGVKDAVRQKLDEDLRSGKFRRSKLISVLWDLPGATIYSPASSTAAEKLLELFERSFDLKLEALSAGAAAGRILHKQGHRRDYDDLRATRFAHGPDGERQAPEYPWILKGPQPKDFLGNEFLLWLWHEAETQSGEVKTESAGAVSVLIERVLDLDCVYGVSGRDLLRGSGPTQMPEARDALRSGKAPRKIGLILEANGHQYSLDLSAEPLAASGVKLPEIEEAENPRVVFEERIALLRDLSKTLDALFETFLRVRVGSRWDTVAGGMRKWVAAAK